MCFCLSVVFTSWQMPTFFSGCSTPNVLHMRVKFIFLSASHLRPESNQPLDTTSAYRLSYTPQYFTYTTATSMLEGNRQVPWETHGHPKIIERASPVWPERNPPWAGWMAVMADGKQPEIASDQVLRWISGYHLYKTHTSKTSRGVNMANVS